MMINQECSRRTFLKCLPVLLLIGKPDEGTGAESICRKEAENLERIAQREAEDFLVQDTREIKRLHLSYDIFMTYAFGTRFKTGAEICMTKNGQTYEASVNIGEPKPLSNWSSVLLSLGRVIGLGAIKLDIRETFALYPGGYRTRRFRQQIEGREALDMEFSEKNVSFSANGHRAELPLVEQNGPMAGFFNYLFFSGATSRMVIIKPHRRVNIDSKVEYIFENNTVQFIRDNGCYRCSFGSLFEILAGDFKYNLIEGSKINLPYTIQIEGIISNRLRNQRDRQLKELEQDCAREKQLTKEEILATDIYIGKDVRGFLKRAKID